MDRLMRAEAAQHQIRKHACRHKRAARAAIEDRNAAQATRVDDQAVLIGLREHLDVARSEAFPATRQRILANNRVALVEAAYDRVEAEAVQ